MGAGCGSEDVDRTTLGSEGAWEVGGAWWSLQIRGGGFLRVVIKWEIKLEWEFRAL